MGKKIVVVNAGPRKGWNTDKLISKLKAGRLLLQEFLMLFILKKSDRANSSL